MKVTSDTGYRRLSLRAAIDAKCKDCIYDTYAPGTWREQVAQCSSLDCALWPVRPAPHSGSFANPYRDPEAVPREWVMLPIGSAFSPHGANKSTDLPPAETGESEEPL